MSDSMTHPTPDRLEGYVDGSLPDGERAVLESHLVRCPRCQLEVEEWRALFAALAGLPQLEPSSGFADRIMAGVRIRQPWPARVAALLRRLVPQSTVGWVLVAAFLALPILTLGGATAWLLSQPWLSVDWLLVFARERAVEAILAVAGQVAAALLETSFVAGILGFVEPVLAAAGLRELGAAAALFAALTMASAWVLYRNLLREPTRERSYVTYSF